MVGQPCQNIGEPGLRIDIVELGGFDECVDSGGALAALIGTCERPVVAPDRDAAQRPLSRIVGHAQAAVIEDLAWLPNKKKARKKPRALVFG
jgi:hypothetical protein